MDYEKAKQIGESVLEKLKPCLEKGAIAGSIRRGKKTVNDIDLVLLPKGEFMVLESIKSVLLSYGKLGVDGTQIVRVKDQDGVKIDCYIATKQNYEVLLLIRTGSKEHNIKLAQEALRQGKQLKFSEGLLDKKTGKLLANTEESIFKELGLEYVEPEKRN